MLTGREFQVLRRLVDGQTNKEIAQGLRVTGKTVEYHVSKLLRKHGAHSRYELADALTPSSRSTLEEARFELAYEDQLQAANNGRHRRYPTDYPSCVVCVLIRDFCGRVLLDKRTAPSGQSPWTVPSGHVFFGETLHDAARRRVKEEMNLEIKALQDVGIHEIVEDDEHLVIVMLQAQVVAGQDSLGTWYAAADAVRLALHPLCRDPLRRYLLSDSKASS
jgi:ADP-ribose pyrophosphatase YjhB (NUDIX family)/DNA-binding CsgD family transcriptional regulator